MGRKRQRSSCAVEGGFIVSYSTFLESQNKSLRDSLHEWKEKCRQDQVIIGAKDDRIKKLEKEIGQLKQMYNEAVEGQ